MLDGKPKSLQLTSIHVPRKHCILHSLRMIVSVKICTATSELPLHSQEAPQVSRPLEAARNARRLFLYPILT